MDDGKFKLKLSEISAADLFNFLEQQGVSVSFSKSEKSKNKDKIVSWDDVSIRDALTKLDLRKNIRINIKDLSSEDMKKISDSLLGAKVQGLAVDIDTLTTDTELQTLSDMVDMHTQQEDPTKPMA